MKAQSRMTKDEDKDEGEKEDGGRRMCEKQC